MSLIPIRSEMNDAGASHDMALGGPESLRMNTDQNTGLYNVTKKVSISPYLRGALGMMKHVGDRTWRLLWLVRGGGDDCGTGERSRGGQQYTRIALDRSR